MCSKFLWMVVLVVMIGVLVLLEVLKIFLCLVVWVDLIEVKLMFVLFLFSLKCFMLCPGL